MFVYDKTFDPKVVLGHRDLITWFSDFAFYLGFLLVYKHISFTLCLCMTRSLTLKYIRILNYSIEHFGMPVGPYNCP